MDLSCIHTATAVLALLGGSPETVRIGGRVRVGGGGEGGAVGTVVAVGKSLSSRNLPANTPPSTADALVLATEVR